MHGVIQKVTKTHRYMVTLQYGRTAIAALRLLQRGADVNQLLKAA